MVSQSSVMMAIVSGTPARRMKPGQVALSAVGGAVEALARAIAPEIVPKRINVVARALLTHLWLLSLGMTEAHYRNVNKAHLIKRPGNRGKLPKLFYLPLKMTL